MVGQLRKVLSLSRHRSLSWPGRIEESCAEHLAIYAALKARDAQGAEALARNHLMRQLEVLRAWRWPRRRRLRSVRPHRHGGTCPCPHPNRSRASRHA